MKDWAKHPWVVDFKQGCLNIKTALQEGNFMLFLKQVAVIGLLFWVLHWTAGKFNDKISDNQAQMNSIETQQRSEKEYMSNKKLLILLEPRFPNIEEKNQWLTSKLLGLFKDADLPTQLDGSPTENDSNSVYLLMSQGATLKASYMKLGKFLERVENDTDYLRVSEVNMTKEVGDLGNNKIFIRFNTIFPKKKIGATMFKNYKELVAKQQEEIKAAASQRTSNASSTAEKSEGAK